MEGHENIDSLLLKDPKVLQRHIIEVLRAEWETDRLFPSEAWEGMVSSSVMVILGKRALKAGNPEEICIILNKRSRRVRQSGDLCCPGGTVETQIDPHLARLLSLPGSPLSTWPFWGHLRKECPQEARLLSLLLATSLREGWEEMRLNPLSVRFLGVLPYQRLLLFRHVIHPMVGWVSWQKRFLPSWEVDKIVSVPIKALLNQAHYARFRLYVPPRLEEKFNSRTRDYPCFICQCGNSTELLWGATYKIVIFFLKLVFGFTPPDYSSLPIVPGLLDEGYIFGRESGH